MIDFASSKIDVRAAFSVSPSPLDFVLPGFLAGTVGALVAPGSTGKSFWALEAAMCIAAAGKGDLMSIRPQGGGRVVLLSLEDPRQIVEHRLHAIAKNLPEAAQEAIFENFDPLDLYGKRIDLMEPGTISGISDYCRGARLVVIDTLSRAHALDENKNGEMAQLMSRMDHVTRETGASFLFLHHVSKGAAREGQGAEQQAARGASVLVDNARWVGFMQKMTEAEAKDARIDADERWRYVRFGASKVNYGAPVPDAWLEKGEGGVLQIADFSASVVPAKKQEKGGWDEIDF